MNKIIINNIRINQFLIDHLDIKNQFLWEQNPDKKVKVIIEHQYMKNIMKSTQITINNN